VRGKDTEDVGDSLTGFEPDLDDAVVRAHLTEPLTDPAAVLDGATTRTLYDVSAYHRTRNDPRPTPPTVYTLSRETHVSDLDDGPSRYQHQFAYSDGFSMPPPAGRPRRCRSDGPAKYD
jgi:hypothetical protein